MQEHPNQVWIVLACDLPFVTPATIRNLISQRNPQKFATAYISTHDGLPEPLCAIYEPQDYQNILQFLKENIHCPRKIMIKSDTELVEQADPQSLENINTPEELKKWVKK